MKFLLRDRALVLGPTAPIFYGGERLRRAVRPTAGWESRFIGGVAQAMKSHFTLWALSGVEAIPMLGMVAIDTGDKVNSCNDLNKAKGLSYQVVE